MQKKDGSLRFCIDYRKVNDVTLKDAYPLPRIDDALSQLQGSQYFSTIDLFSGYWQVEVDPADQAKTAFATRRGLFEFRVMPFGLCNAPATFQRLMETVLAGLNWEICLIYIDDIIITGRTFEDMIQNLEKVFQRLESAGLKLKAKKCYLFAKQVSFLGHLISGEGIKADPDKIKAVEEWIEPRSVTEVRSFIGLCSYYRKFIKDFASEARPLHNLLEKNREFKWSEDCQNAFEELRKRLTSAPVLAHPDFNTHFILDTDASDHAIGGVLSQVIDGQETSNCIR